MLELKGNAIMKGDILYATIEYHNYIEVALNINADAKIISKSELLDLIKILKVVEQVYK